jgi:hypothetical protein
VHFIDLTPDRNEAIVSTSRHVMHAGRCTLVLAGAAALGALALAGPASAQTVTVKATQDASDSDPPGDSKSAPDIGTVVVSLDSGSNMVGFGIRLNNDNLSNNGGAVVLIDADATRLPGIKAPMFVGAFQEGAREEARC